MYPVLFVERHFCPRRSMQRKISLLTSVQSCPYLTLGLFGLNPLSVRAPVFWAEDLTLGCLIISIGCLAGIEFF